MLSCMGISGNWRTVISNLAVRVTRRELGEGMPTSAHRVKAGLVRKAPVINRTAVVTLDREVAIFSAKFIFWLFSRMRLEFRTKLLNNLR